MGRLWHTTLMARFMRPTWGPSGPTGPKWVPCWPHEPCYQGRLSQWVLTKMAHILKCIFVNKKHLVSIQIPLNFVPKGPIYDKTALVHVMPRWRSNADWFLMHMISQNTKQDFVLKFSDKFHYSCTEYQHEDNLFFQDCLYTWDFFTFWILHIFNASKVNTMWNVSHHMEKSCISIFISITNTPTVAIHQ